MRKREKKKAHIIISTILLLGYSDEINEAETGTTYREMRRKHRTWSGSFKGSARVRR
jgi:hypothetical protein